MGSRAGVGVWIWSTRSVSRVVAGLSRHGCLRLIRRPARAEEDSHPTVGPVQLQPAAYLRPLPPRATCAWRGCWRKP